MNVQSEAGEAVAHPAIHKRDWKTIARTLLHSRFIDEIEEIKLVPDKKVLYQFSARGHELGQILLASFINHKHDGISAYYRSRPLMLASGLSLEDAVAAPMMKSGGYSDGRDIGVVCNMPGNDGPTVLPMAGDVGSQYTPAVGWAQAIEYRRNVLKEKEYEGAISVVLGGDGSVATNGFWSSLTIATAQNLPLLFYIEDNGYGISVQSKFQTPGGNIAKNLYSFKNLRIFDGDGTNPSEVADLLEQSVQYVRERKGPVLVRLTVPRLNGHSYQDNQSYKSEKILKEEKKRDPLNRLKGWLVPDILSKSEWTELEKESRKEVEEAIEKAGNRNDPDPENVKRYTFSESKDDGSADLQIKGGLLPEG
ncbi:MAG TPA: thiamine pyrophosphate-dependent enzyme, partial [Balneolales bacterium]|nr:thiamine pyrophosphate-dependent enzyme [Balneolales bacterium]